MQRFLDRLGGNGPSFVTKWTWRDGALWHLTTYASGWQEWKTFDEVAQSWHWVTQADKEALKDCAFARQLFFGAILLTPLFIFLFVASPCARKRSPKCTCQGHWANYAFTHQECMKLLVPKYHFMPVILHLALRGWDNPSSPSTSSSWWLMTLGSCNLTEPGNYKWQCHTSYKLLALSAKVANFWRWNIVQLACWKSPTEWFQLWVTFYILKVTHWETTLRGNTLSALGG